MENRKVLRLGTPDKGLRIVATDAAITIHHVLASAPLDDKIDRALDLLDILIEDPGPKLSYSLNLTEAAKLRDFLDRWLMETGLWIPPNPRDQT
jgi:hypothetical protein